MTPEEQAAALSEFHADRWLAHSTLFPHRHPAASPPAHVALVKAIYQPAPRASIEAFRGFGKSTTIEEAIVILAGLREFHNLVIVGSSYARAVDRLTSVKREIEINATLEEVFGVLKGNLWQEGKIVLSNGLCIQAMGRDQSMVGLKYLDYRPDAAIIDDLEDPDEVRGDPEREATWKWFMESFLPSLDHPLRSWVRVIGTRRGKGSLPERLEDEKWPVVKFPIEYTDRAGVRCATWPGKFPLEIIDEMRQTYRSNLNTFDQEFMCRAMSASAQIFKREMFRTEPRVRIWEATYAFIDPARTTNRDSAATGWAVWSWLQSRLIVWAAGDPMLLPDEIISLAFDLVERFDPVWIGIERTGLEQWLMQPMRHEQVRRGITLPVRGIQAVAQAGLIAGLQPFFSAREVIFAQPLPALENQLLSFPSGRRDTANALAYAPLMRPAAAIYDGFTGDHVVERPELVFGRPIYLAANATGGLVTAVLAQVADDRISVIADWVMEGSADERVREIHAAALLATDLSQRVQVSRTPNDLAELLKNVVPDTYISRRISPVWTAAPHHAERYTNVGLIQAVKALPAEIRTGGEENQGQAYFREALNRTVRGIPAVEISRDARWTLRALSGGYTRAMQRGRLQDHAEEGPYRVLMEGLEAFFALIRATAEREDEDDNPQPVVYDAQGRRYMSAMPARERGARR